MPVGKTKKRNTRTRKFTAARNRKATSRKATMTGGGFFGKSSKQKPMSNNYKQIQHKLQITSGPELKETNHTINSVVKAWQANQKHKAEEEKRVSMRISNIQNKIKKEEYLTDAKLRELATEVYHNQDGNISEVNFNPKKYNNLIKAAERVMPGITTQKFFKGELNETNLPEKYTNIKRLSELIKLQKNLISQDNGTQGSPAMAASQYNNQISKLKTNLGLADKTNSEIRKIENKTLRDYQQELFKQFQNKISFDILAQESNV